MLRHLMGENASGSAGLPADDDPFATGLESVHLFWRCDFAGAARTAAVALREASDADAIALAHAAAGLAVGGSLDAVGDSTLRAASLIEPGDIDTPSPTLRPVLVGLLAEAALGNARVASAGRWIALAPPPSHLFGGPHPFVAFLGVLAARIAAFEGDITRAEREIASALQLEVDPRVHLFVTGCAMLVRGNADRAADTRALARNVAAAGAPSDVVARGILVLAAFGVLALGDTEEAARLFLVAGGDADLSALRITDRALGLETLVAAAVAQNDFDAAEAWLERMAPLTAHPAGVPPTDRAHSRVRLLRGDANGAVEAAERAIAGAVLDGRTVEAREGEIVRARARIARTERGDAARELAALVTFSQARGHHAVRRSAARELRLIGRRLPPAVASGWDGLSTREREVAVLIGEGWSNRAVARDLFLSERTVQGHVSRVLHAFGVATRSGVAAALGGAAGEIAVGASAPDSLDLPPLTPRQRRVLAELSTGATNRQIAERLGIGVTTVEKHLTAMMRLWQVTSRSGLVHLASRAPDAR